jgi:starch synthase
VHNLAYHGLFDGSRLHALGIPEAAYSINGVEFHHKLSFLKAGLTYAAHVTTVSPTYAREIMTEELGCGLHGQLAALAASTRFSGIANGIGEDWSPEHDHHLVQNYPPRTHSAKQRNADAVRQQLGLKKSRGPLFAIVSRLVHQKGIDLALDAAEGIANAGGQLVLVGEGDHDLEAAATRIAGLHPGIVGVKIAFDKTLSRRAIAGSDFYLMPSRFEPCGLNQMYAQRYGSLPIAHATGGLVDTIKDGKTGFLYSGESTDALNAAILRALQVYLDPQRCTAMRRAAMREDFTWSTAAGKYEILYCSALRRAQQAGVIPSGSNLTFGVRV